MQHIAQQIVARRLGLYTVPYMVYGRIDTVWVQHMGYLYTVTIWHEFCIWRDGLVLMTAVIRYDTVTVLHKKVFKKIYHTNTTILLGVVFQLMLIETLTGYGLKLMSSMANETYIYRDFAWVQQWWTRLLKLPLVTHSKPTEISANTYSITK